MRSPHRLNIGLALFVLCIATAVTASAQTFTLLNSFSGTTGGYTNAPLVQGIDGNLYGAGLFGGMKNGQVSNGTVYKSTLAGELTLVHDFHPNEGVNPQALVLETNGNLFGVTGGTAPSGGTVFGFTSQGTIFVVHSFSRTGTGGSFPGALTLGPDGSTFYGVATEGGTDGFGTVYRVTTSGNFLTLHNFTNGADGGNPTDGPLVVGTDGNLYGITLTGGSSGEGTVFRMTPGGTLTTIHNFSGSGGEPRGSLVQGSDGNFYGTTADFQTYLGTVFKISPSGNTFQTLYNFTGDLNGGFPAIGLVLGSDGNFYGMTVGSGNDNDYGTLFQVTPGGVFTTLHSFDGADGGNYPYLMQDTNGTFYGTTSLFGTGSGCPPEQGCGTIFSLSMGLGPFVEAVPSYRGIGTRVLLLGQGFTGASGVTFNGVSATFTVSSDTEIVTTVPTGATSGFIVVTTPSGTVSTKVFFTVG